MTAFLLMAAAILVPVFAGWRVWKHLDKGVDPDNIEGTESVRALVYKLGVSTGVVFFLMLLSFTLIKIFLAD